MMVTVTPRARQYIQEKGGSATAQIDDRLTGG